MSDSPLRDGLRLCLGTLTALRVRPPGRVDRHVARVAMLAAALPGLMLGTVATTVAALGSAAGAPTLVSAAAAVGSVALASRGLHLDGLADTADGLTASYDRDRALEVMRRGNVGPAGAVTLVLVLLAQTASVAALLGHGPWWRGPVAAGLAVLAGRAVLPLVCAGPWPAARAEGLGAAVARSVPVWGAITSAATVLGVMAVLAQLTGLRAAVVVAAVVAGWLVGLLLVDRVARRLGGTTGDVLGAAVETTSTVTAVVLAAALT